jgi:host factor-I protein
MDAAKQAIEPLFLSEALSQGVTLRIGQMNKTEHEGVVREVGRYEINVEEKGGVITILKQDITYLSAPAPLVKVPGAGETTGQSPPQASGGAHLTKPNVQQEFLDKAMKENHLLTVFLITGQRVRATVEAYDNFTLLLREGGKQHLYYKHAITTINR